MAGRTQYKSGRVAWGVSINGVPKLSGYDFGSTGIPAIKDTGGTDRLTVTTSGITVNGAMAGIKVTSEAHTAGDTLTAAESGSTHTNAGASGAITIVLPAATVGLRFRFVVKAAQELRIDPSGSETIALPSSGAQGAAGKYISADAVGEFVDVECVAAGAWESLSYKGTWTQES